LSLAQRNADNFFIICFGYLQNGKKHKEMEHKTIATDKTFCDIFPQNVNQK